MSTVESQAFTVSATPLPASKFKGKFKVNSAVASHRMDSLFWAVAFHLVCLYLVACAKNEEMEGFCQELPRVDLWEFGQNVSSENSDRSWNRQG